MSKRVMRTLPSVLRAAAVPAAALALLAGPARAQSAEAPVSAANGVRADTLVRGVTANESLRQRWASPFAVEGSGETAPREPRAHVTWLAPDTGRRGTAATRAGRTQRADTTRRAAPPAAPAPAAARPRTHTVARGETFLGIARRYGVSQDALRTANPGVEWQHVRIGVVLRIPAAPAAFQPPRATTRPAASTRAAARPDTASDDSAGDAAPPRPTRRDSTARSANTRRDTTAARPTANRPSRRDSAAARPASRRDSTAARATTRRDSASARPAARRDSMSARPTARRDSAAARPASRRDSTSVRTATRRDSTATAVRRPTNAPRDTVVIGGRTTGGRDSTNARRTGTPRDTVVIGRRPAPAPANGTRRHTVAAGESLFSIARTYGVPAQRIRDVNGLTDDRVHVGQLLVIPPGA